MRPDLARINHFEYATFGPAKYFWGVHLFGLGGLQNELAGRSRSSHEAGDVNTGRLAPEGYPQNPDTNARFLFELRTKDGQSWLDAFVTGAGYRSLLLFEDKKHPVGQWYHVAQTYDGKIHRSYVNGVLQGELALSAYKPMGPGATSVGTRINRVKYFKGALRQARFTRRALAPDQFLKLSTRK